MFWHCPPVDSMLTVCTLEFQSLTSLSQAFRSYQIQRLPNGKQPTSADDFFARAVPQTAVPPMEAVWDSMVIGLDDSFGRSCDSLSMDGYDNGVAVAGAPGGLDVDHLACRLGGQKCCVHRVRQRIGAVHSQFRS
jgi:hypothetical protein